MSELRRALAEGGKAAVTGFTSMRRLLGVSLSGGQGFAQVSAHVTEGSGAPVEVNRGRQVRPQIERRYRFAELRAAIAYLEQGHARAKVVAEVARWREAALSSAPFIEVISQHTGVSDDRSLRPQPS